MSIVELVCYGRVISAADLYQLVRKLLLITLKLNATIMTSSSSFMNPEMYKMIKTKSTLKF